MRTGSRHSNAIETKSQNIAIMQHTTDILSKKKNTPIEVDSPSLCFIYTYLSN